MTLPAANAPAKPLGLELVAFLKDARVRLDVDREEARRNAERERAERARATDAGLNPAHYY